MFGLNQLEPGAVSVDSKFNATTVGGNVKMTYSAGRGRKFVSMLVGVIRNDEKEPSSLKLRLWLNSLGWYSGEQIEEFFGKKKTEEFGKHLNKFWKEKKDELES